MSQDNNGNNNGNNGEGGAMLEIKVNMEKLREAKKKVLSGAKKMVERKNKCNADIDMEDFKLLLESMDKKEVIKLIAWGAKNATDPEVKSYCRKMVGAAAGGTVVVGGLLTFFLS